MHKTLCDMGMLMNFVTKLVEDRGGLPTEITLDSTEAMFQSVSDTFTGGRGRNAQKKWTTLVDEARRVSKKIEEQEHQ